MTYSRLSYSDRNFIESQLFRGASQSAIARSLGVHRSTICNELQRNGVKGSYSARLAQYLTERRFKRLVILRAFSRRNNFRLSSRKRPDSLLDIRVTKDNRKLRLLYYKERRLEREKNKRPFAANRYRWRKRRRNRNHWTESLCRNVRCLADWQAYNRRSFYFPGKYLDRVRRFYKNPAVAVFKRRFIHRLFASTSGWKPQSTNTRHYFRYLSQDPFLLFNPLLRTRSIGGKPLHRKYISPPPARYKKRLLLKLLHQLKTTFYSLHNSPTQSAVFSSTTLKRSSQMKITGMVYTSPKRNALFEVLFAKNKIFEAAPRVASFFSVFFLLQYIIISLQIILTCCFPPFFFHCLLR